MNTEIKKEVQLTLDKNENDVIEDNEFAKVKTPPIKCQGIKTKIIPHIIENLDWSGGGRWIEPFLGSGVVLFNIKPDRALVNDINPHIINFYNAIKDGTIDSQVVKTFLIEEGEELRKFGLEHYKYVRDRFNMEGNPLDFLFLNRSCFNGVIRFNTKGKFNVPYNHKSERFRQHYITKIVNQVKYVENLIQNKDWEFVCKDWKDVLKGVRAEDFVYLDPPYIGRHTDYYNTWKDEDATEMAKQCKELPCNFMISMWKSNKYRHNTHLEEWKGYRIVDIEHFYHVGATENLRNAMIEVLIMN
jgi:DNA adenine methylase